jgi:hypothetical protein
MALIFVPGRGSTSTAGGDPVIATAGDICGGCGPTAKIISNHPEVDKVLTLGDNVYPCGGLSLFNSKYDPKWGAFKSMTSPATGNHEYETNSSYPGCNTNATGYFQYFGSAAQPNGSNGYYYTDIAGTGTSTAKWRIIVLNATCRKVPGGCGSGSPQEQFLRSALSSAPSGSCILAAWHQPRFSGGSSTPLETSLAFWNDLYGAHAAAILNGHKHYYERFLPQDPSGKLDIGNGIPEFIVGTGGATLGSPKYISPNTATWTKQFGVLILRLHAASFDWQFIPTGNNGQPLDSGTAPCTRKP